MQEYEFTLLLEGISELNEAVENAIFEAGCDDALLAFRFGRGELSFARKANCLREAVLSAIEDAERSGVATVARVDYCDLVTQAEIAKRIGYSRQVVSMYCRGKRGPGGFPPPVCNLTDEQMLWYWCEVSAWLNENNIVRIEGLEQSQELAKINHILELRRWFPDSAGELLAELKPCG